MKVSGGRYKALCALLLLVGLGYALKSVETMRISTTYPAPSGVYKKIITTGQTILAQKTGSVVIGKVDSPTRKLEVEKGASFGGQVDMGTYKIANAADPTDNQDCATKNYVDSKAANCTDLAQGFPAKVTTAQFYIIDYNVNGWRDFAEVGNNSLMSSFYPRKCRVVSSYVNYLWPPTITGGPTDYPSSCQVGLGQPYAVLVTMNPDLPRMRLNRVWGVVAIEWAR